MNINNRSVHVMQAERRSEILSIVRKEGRITIDEICERFNVSEMTARRDLHELDREGLLRRVHGGGIGAFGSSYEPPYQIRSQNNREAKEAIGRKAVELIDDGDSIALDIGTTTLTIARSLKDRHNLTVVTASLPIAYELISNHSLGNDLRMILTGGIVRSGELSMIGHISQQTFNELHVDKAFIGIGGISFEFGLTEFNLEDSLVKRALIRTARRIIVVADSSKLGRAAFTSVCPLSSVDTLVTDSGISKTMIEAFSETGIKVVISE
jgi:DeoR/GlpR family transcriptional regulator of sugar metabolism